MISVFFKILSIFMSFWGGLNQEQKDKIINIVVECFEHILRQYYRDNKGETSNG